jgi:hypothetical protein
MSDPQFTLGVTYWPRRRRPAEGPLCTWSEVDQGAVRAELEHIADLGFDTVRLELRWAEALPGTRISTAALRGLEQALDYAADYRLRVVVATLGGSLGGALHLPPWAVGYRLSGDTQRARRFGPPVVILPDNQPPVLIGDRYAHEPVRDLYGEPEILEAQRLVLREVVGNLGAHPAAVAWQLGADLERARRPSSARAAAVWWADLAARARELGARAVVGVLSPLSLSRSDHLRPAAIVAQGGQIAISAAPLPPLLPGRGDRAPAGAFLHALVAGLLYAETDRRVPVVVADVGLATAVGDATGLVADELFGRPATIALADEERQASLIEEALATLYREGAAGVCLARYADIHPDLWTIAPADRSWWARSAGLVAPDGREKPAAAAVRTFAARRSAGSLPTPATPPALPLDPERYWSDPAANLRELWEDWHRV